ncbi:RraA family protein [Cytobacillus depressus]|uniref:Putative 4-hydroxy-4-methyl-2-oxoglutarate aldolase n=1 Tax=Cytobacillus depressus TaxID=1602942 RepID=A0A6L3V6B5_9BACI|nr:RraA family protein [Cytobacillus depressus]KAB2336105.1 RraA family protein [Cytobacillus depressus]
MNIVDQFKEVPTTCISDALDGMTNLDASIKPLKEEYRVAGRAFTVQMQKGDNLVVLKAIREAQPGDVIVIDAKGDTNRAIAGDFILGMAQTLGIKGIIVDGVIRDILGAKELDYPVFCKGTTIAAGNKIGKGSINVPISCGGVTIHPGDIVVGDADGVIVIPREKEEEVLKQTQDKLEKDIQREKKVSNNKEEIIQYLDKMLS